MTWRERKRETNNGLLITSTMSHTCHLSTTRGLIDIHHSDGSNHKPTQSSLSPGYTHIQPVLLALLDDLDDIYIDIDIYAHTHIGEHF